MSRLPLTTGAALLLLCGAALGQTKLFTWTAAGGNDQFGWSVSDAGDVNGLGFPGDRGRGHGAEILAAAALCCAPEAG